MQPRPNLKCPLCGGPNECAAASSGSFATPCWCAQLTVSADVLARLPAHERDRACLCRKCLTGATTTSNAQMPSH
jgi:hypothetical protein